MEYYSVLGVGVDASDEEIRRAYRKLAMQWHPDKWIRAPSHLMEAKQKFQQIQEAYAVLSDRQKRMLYDAGLYDLDDDDEDEVEGFADFLGEMVSLMNDARKEEKNYSIEELQSMFWEMAQDFETPQWTTSNAQPPPSYNGTQCSYGPFSNFCVSNFYDFGTAESDSLEANMMMQGDSHLEKMNFQTYGAHQCCR